MCETQSGARSQGKQPMRSHTRPDAPILVVEDDATAAEIFGLSLREAGYRVQLAGDAESALSFVEHATPVVAIVDLHLPTADGLELVRGLRAHPNSAAIPVALITGDYFVDDAITEAAKGLGARIFFKPIWHDDLAQIVAELMSRTAAVT